MWWLTQIPAVPPVLADQFTFTGVTAHLSKKPQICGKSLHMSLALCTGMKFNFIYHFSPQKPCKKHSMHLAFPVPFTTVPLFLYRTPCKLPFKTWKYATISSAAHLPFFCCVSLSPRPTFPFLPFFHVHSFIWFRFSRQVFPLLCKFYTVCKAYRHGQHDSLPYSVFHELVKIVLKGQGWS